MNTPLTIGIPTYEDPDGVWFTLQGLAMYHPRVSYLVLDNSPRPCDRTQRLLRAIGGTYTHRPDLTGTSIPKDALFRFAKTPWVLCLDSHVLLELGAIAALLTYIGKHPESNDLIQGPLVFDDGEFVATHWEQHQPPALWGQWTQYTCWRQDEPFEIPCMGMGLFAMRKQAWPGFHPLFRGFGGEEGYIHEKVRQRGGKCLCLPALQWRHRFRDGIPPPYRLSNEDQVWNALVGHREVGVEATDVIRKELSSIDPEKFDSLKQEAERVQPMGVPYGV